MSSDSTPEYLKRDIDKFTQQLEQSRQYIETDDIDIDWCKRVSSLNYYSRKLKELLKMEQWIRNREVVI